MHSDSGAWGPDAIRRRDVVGSGVALCDNGGDGPDRDYGHWIRGDTAGGTRMKILTQMQESMATNVFPPDQDIHRVEVRQRRGWEGLVWEME
ncbi:MAG: hypothetical protein Q9212_003313 [Teloschistes hypoglaucus]